MDEVEFSDWLEGMGRLSVEQIALAMAKLVDCQDRSSSALPVAAVAGSSEIGCAEASSTKGGAGKSGFLD